MLVLRNLLLVVGAALLLAAAALLIHDIYRVIQSRRGPEERPALRVRLRDSGRLGMLSLAPLLLGLFSCRDKRRSACAKGTMRGA